MIERRGLTLLAREPLYNTRAVVQLTQVPADTFRAWERRYGLPQPYRTSGNQRLYSERDIGIILWLRDRTVEGMTISQAIQRLRVELPALDNNPPPQDSPLEPELQASIEQESSVAQFRRRIVEAIIDFDDTACDRAIDEAFGLFSIETCCNWVLEPVLVDVGDRWERGELTVSAEHFATRLIQRRLYVLLASISPPSHRGVVITACPQGEQHEVGLLILSIFLARRNLRVIYLGANVPAPDLVTTVTSIEPDLVCLGASATSTAEVAMEVARQIAALDSPPQVMLGGRGFVGEIVSSAQPLPSRVEFAQGGAQAASDQIVSMLERRRMRATTPSGVASMAGHRNGA